MLNIHFDAIDDLDEFVYGYINVAGTVNNKSRSISISFTRYPSLLTQ